MAKVWSPAWRRYCDCIIVNFELAANLMQQIQNLLICVVHPNKFGSKSKRQLDLDLWKFDSIT